MRGLESAAHRLAVDLSSCTRLTPRQAPDPPRHSATPMAQPSCGMDRHTRSTKRGRSHSRHPHGGGPQPWLFSNFARMFRTTQSDPGREGPRADPQADPHARAVAVVRPRRSMDKPGYEKDHRGKSRTHTIVAHSSCHPHSNSLELTHPPTHPLIHSPTFSLSPTSASASALGPHPSSPSPCMPPDARAHVQVSGSVRTRRF